MTHSDQAAVEDLVRTARSLFDRGYSFGTAGNVSIRVGAVIYSTPTGSSLGTLTADSIAVSDLVGTVTGFNKPTKELHFHIAAYQARRQSRAVVHLHSTYATALSCLADLNTEDALPVLTPYYAMRVPSLPVVPYLPPGDPALAPEVERRARRTPAFLLRNHGSIAIGTTLAEAAALAEEVEEAARLFFILGENGQPLSPEQVAQLRHRLS